LFKKYDRTSLLYLNYIDMNIFIHKKELVDIHGLFDIKLSRLVDWDLILRYTKGTKGKALKYVGAKYFTTAKNRITKRENLESNLHIILQKNYNEILNLGIDKLIKNDDIPIWIRTIDYKEWLTCYCNFFKYGEINDKT
jgi:hypothetical protein